MNSYYDKIGAEVWLDGYISRTRQESGGPPLIQDFQLGDTRIQKYAEPISHRLVMGNGENMEEVQVRIPGILCGKLLPPITRAISTPRKDQVRGLRQYVKLTGIESVPFKSGVGRVGEIAQKFESEINGTVAGAVFKAYDAHEAVDLHTRYFCDRDQVPNQTHVPFSATEDPLHILEDLRGSRYIRTLDNIVEYCVKEYTEDAQVEYKAMAPDEFKEGDVVEANVSFVCYPLKSGSQRLVPTLRSLVLISTQFREGAEKSRDEERQRRANGVKRPMMGEPGPPTPKRRFIQSSMTPSTSTVGNMEE